MKNLFTKIIIGVTAMVMCLSVFSGCKKESENLAGYVAVDINPSVEFITDKDGKVAEVRAVNDDAKVLLVDMNLKNIDISLAIEKITKEAEACGYINSDNLDVSITISGNTDKAESKLKELAEKGVKRGSDIAKIAHDAIYAELESQVEALKTGNPDLYQELTVAKLKIINSIMEYDRYATLEELANKDMDELVKMLRAYVDQFADLFDDELEVKFKEKLNELAAGVYAQIDALMGDATVQAKLELLRKLEILEEKFENQFEKASIDGDYRFNFDRDFDDEDEDDDDELLIADMKAELMLVINDQSVVDAIVTIEDLDDYIDDLEEEIEAIYDNLPNQVKAQIKQIETQIEAFKEVAKEFVKGLSTSVRVELKLQKDMMKLPIGD